MQPTSNSRTNSPHPIMQYYQPQQPSSSSSSSSTPNNNLQSLTSPSTNLTYGSSHFNPGFSSGFTIPTSNSRPTSPRRDHGSVAEDLMRPSPHYGLEPSGSMHGQGIPGWTTQPHHPPHHGHYPSSTHQLNQRGSTSPSHLPQYNNQGGGYMDIPPSSKKRRLSSLHPQPPMLQKNPSTSFLTGLRGAEDLPHHPHASVHGGQPSTRSPQAQEDDYDNSEGDSGDEGTVADGASSAGGAGERGKRGERGRAGKMKLTRGSRACTVCRRLKMKCVASPGPHPHPCVRCRNGGLECVFEESMRGKRGGRGKKSEIMARNLREVENTLDTVLRSIHNPKLSLASGMTNLSPSMSTKLLNGSPSGDPGAGLEISSPEKELAGAGQLDHLNQPNRPGITPLINNNHPSGESCSASRAGNRPPDSPRLHSLPDNTLNPLGLLAEASLQNRKRSNTGMNGEGRDNGTGTGTGNGDMGGNGETDSVESGLNGAEALRGNRQEGEVKVKRLGVGDASYFRPGPMTSLGLRRVIIERELKPEILTFTTAAQINDLFDVFFEKMHRNVPILNRELHTPAAVCARSPFLLTTICAIASRFYTKDPTLRPKLATVTKKLMLETPARGYKSLEMVQAYILLICWTLGPEERWEQDLSYLLLGMAIRIATDMNLYKKNVVMPLDTEEGRIRDREIANRERTWLLCFIFDRSQSAQMGRPYSIREDAIVRECHLPSWYNRSSSQPEDFVLAAYAELQRIMSRALDTLYSQYATNASGLVLGVDYPLVVSAVNEQLEEWIRKWEMPIGEMSLPALADGTRAQSQHMYTVMARFYQQYNSLVLSSFALQYAIEISNLDLPVWFSKVATAASAVLAVVKDQLAPMDYLAYCTDGQVVMICYAVLSLLKLIRPEFKTLQKDPQTILTLLNEIVDCLARTAVDEVHSVGLYATLLRNLVANKAEEVRTDWGDADKQKDSRSQRSKGPTTSLGGSNLGVRFNEEEGILWDAYSGYPGSRGANQFHNEVPGLNGTTPTIVPNNLDGQNIGVGIPGSSTTAMNGTIWPHAAVSSAPTPTAEHQLESSHSGSGELSGNFMDNLGLPTYGVEDINWENSLLMPGFGNFGQLELSGGFVHTQFGSGIISPSVGMTPAHSRPATPSRLRNTQLHQ